MYALGLARLVIIPLELIVILVFARIFFSVQVTGSYFALLAVAFGGSACFASMAIAVASRAENTETVSGLMNLITMPMFITSGVFFASSNFPESIQPVIRMLPLTAMCDGLRAVMIDGAGLGRRAALAAHPGPVGRAFVPAWIALLPLELNLFE
jgi:ABC-2 type transport system permease protein